MDREYVVFRDTIIEALNHLEQFESKMDNFINKNPHYSYTSDVKEVGGVWEVKVKVTKNEQANIKTT